VAFRVKPATAAAQQIRNESQWWRRNRTKAPTLFRDELRRVFALLAEYPEAGQLLKISNLQMCGASFSSTDSNYVYYRVNRPARRIEILAVWSTKSAESRQSLPPTSR